MRQISSNTTSTENSSFAEVAARLISDLVNPLFIPPLVFLILGWISDIPMNLLGWVAAFSIAFYTAIPLLVTFSLLKSGHIESLDLPKRATRSRLFGYSIISSAAGSAFLGILLYTGYPFLMMAAVVFMFNPIFGYLINRKWKISMHTASVAAAGVIFLSFFVITPSPYKTTAAVFSFAVLLVLLPLMIWSRYYLRVHSAPELIGGTIAGIALTMLELSIMFRIW